MKKYNPFIIVIILSSFGRNTDAQNINYYQHIKPIMTRHCMPCHTKENVGPMALTTYQEVSAYAKMIQFVTSNNLMPPWNVDLHYSEIKSVSKLTANEISLIEQWIVQKLPEGKMIPSKNIPAKQLDKYDYIFTMQQTYTHQGGYVEESRVFVIPINLEKDVSIDALEFVPFDKKLISSCTISIDTSSISTRFDSYDLNYGYGTLSGLSFIPYQYNWYQWTSDKGVEYLKDGYVKNIPAHCRILFHITYLPTHVSQKDSSYLKVRVLKNSKVQKVIQSDFKMDKSNLSEQLFFINKYEKRKFIASVTLKKPMEIHCIMPQGQFICKSWEVYAIDKETGNQINLLKIPDWDFHWKKKYELKKPIFLPAGTEIRAIAHYDNSEENLNIPLFPPDKIQYGEGKREELFLVQFDVVYL